MAWWDRWVTFISDSSTLLTIARMVLEDPVGTANSNIGNSGDSNNNNDSEDDIRTTIIRKWLQTNTTSESQERGSIPVLPRTVPELSSYVSMPINETEGDLLHVPSPYQASAQDRPSYVDCTLQDGGDSGEIPNEGLPTTHRLPKWHLTHAF